MSINDEELNFEFSPDFFDSIALSAEDVVFSLKISQIEGIRVASAVTDKLKLLEIEKQFGIA